MNYFHMTYDQILQSPMQRLVMLAKSIPKYDAAKPDVTQESDNNPLGLLEFAQKNNLIK